MWTPLLFLAAALASDTAEQPRYVQGDGLPKTIWDHVEDLHLLPIVDLSRQMVETTPDWPRFLQAFATRLGARVDEPGFVGTASLVYALAKATKKTVWKLDEEVFEALANTEPPYDLLRERLPRLPFPSLLVMLPDEAAIEVKVADPGDMVIRVTSILVTEDVPGQRWRYLGIEDTPNPRALKYSKGWFDVGSASAKTQLVEGKGFAPAAVPGATYATFGEDVVWKLLLNLFTALENKEYLEGQRVVPARPRGSRHEKARVEKTRSPLEYTVVRLSATSRRERDEEAERAGGSTSSSRGRHLVSGHWHSFWVLEPEGRMVLGTKPRIDREGKQIGGNLYKVARWVFPFWKGQGDGPSPDKPKKYLVKP